MTVRWCIPLLALGLVAAPASAQFGSFVAKTDADYTPTVSFRPHALCWSDRNSDLRYTPGEALYLAAACGRLVRHDDLRLVSTTAGKGNGTAVRTGDADTALPLSGPLDHAVRYVDADPDGRMKSKDALFVDLFRLDASRVDAGDLRLTASGGRAPGTNVVPGDADQHMPLTAMRNGGLRFSDAAMLFKAGDGHYVNGGVAARTVVDENDVRVAGTVADPLAALRAAPPARIRGLAAAPVPVPGAAGLVLLHVAFTVENTGAFAGAPPVVSRVDGAVVDVRGAGTLAPGQPMPMAFALLVPAGAARLEVGDQNVSLSTADGASGELGMAPEATAPVPAPSAASLATAAPALPAAPAPSVPPTFLFTPRPQAAATQEAPGAGAVLPLAALAALALLRRRLG